jgi:hypothetical protein
MEHVIMLALHILSYVIAESISQPGGGNQKKKEV